MQSLSIHVILLLIFFMIKATQRGFSISFWINLSEPGSFIFCSFVYFSFFFLFLFLSFIINTQATIITLLIGFGVRSLSMSMGYVFLY